MTMSDNDGKEATRREEQQDLEHQQQDLFRELSREQTEAEEALEDHERSVKPQAESAE
jgi:hypothetical protein